MAAFQKVSGFSVELDPCEKLQRCMLKIQNNQIYNLCLKGPHLMRLFTFKNPFKNMFLYNLNH